MSVIYLRVYDNRGYMKHQKRIFLPGQRILRSAAAVALCLLVDVLRGHQGIPLYSAIAALQCMQPYTKDMRGVARKRVIGTVIGAAWGLLLLLAEIFIAREGLPDTRLHYVLVPLTLILVLYSTVLLKIQETAYFSGVVFLVITINHFTDANPYLYRGVDSFGSQPSPSATQAEHRYSICF